MQQGAPQILQPCATGMADSFGQERVLGPALPAHNPLSSSALPHGGARAQRCRRAGWTVLSDTILAAKGGRCMDGTKV